MKIIPNYKFTSLSNTVRELIIDNRLKIKPKLNGWIKSQIHKHEMLNELDFVKLVLNYAILPACKCSNTNSLSITCIINFDPVKLNMSTASTVVTYTATATLVDTGVWAWLEYVSNPCQTSDNVSAVWKFKIPH